MEILNNTLGDAFCTIDKPNFGFSYLTLNFKKDSDVAANVATVLEKIGGKKVIWGLVCGGTSFQGKFPEFDKLPFNWILGDTCQDNYIASVQFMLVDSADNFSYIYEGDKCLGAKFEDETAEYCFLNSIVDSNLNNSRFDQSINAFEKVNTLLEANGMTFLNVARTWLYLDDLLDWYDEFNVARTDFFNKYGVFDNLVPASTGIGAKNADGGALVIAAMAVKAKKEGLTVAEVNSPLQCPAWDYKSSFSRATEIATPDWHKITVSGTASIEPGGKTVHLDEIVPQIELTMEVIKAILAERDLTFEDTMRAVAYCKEIEFLPHFQNWLKANDLESMPVAFCHADVCRDDLLFEVELDVAKNKRVL